MIKKILIALMSTIVAAPAVAQQVELTCTVNLDGGTESSSRMMLDLDNQTLTVFISDDETHVHDIIHETEKFYVVWFEYPNNDHNNIFIFDRKTGKTRHATIMDNGEFRTYEGHCFQSF